jgi:signal transduction histidine kinase
VVQESLTNIAKYAQASSVTVVLKPEREGFTLQVSDDGIGISVNPISEPGSYGIVGMRERISQLSGKFAISPRSEDGGTLVEAFIPFAGLRSSQERTSTPSVVLPVTLMPRVVRSAQTNIAGNRSQSLLSSAQSTQN